MPSTNKLPNTGLNQWLITDKPAMEDFNRDNEIIDAMAGHLKKTPYIGPDLHWYVWDTDKGEYTKAGMAQGEAGPAGPQGIQGPKGETGEKGETGAGFRILGIYGSEDALQSAHPNGFEGDAYAVGSTTENTVYIWSANDGAWKNIGKLQGPQGVQGPKGPQGEPGPQGPQGSPSIINGKVPDESGKLTLTAADVGALAENWRPTADDVTETGARKFVTAEEKAAIGEIADKAGKSKVVDATLNAADWTEENGAYQQTITVSEVLASSVNEIIPAESITAEKLKALQAANLQDGGQTDGKMTLVVYGIKPELDLPVRIIIRSDM